MKLRRAAGLLRHLTISAFILLVLTGCENRQDMTGQTPESQASNVDTTGHQDWETIVEVLLHPRCLNCHQMEMPLIKQGSPHVPRVERGPDNMGLGTMRCSNCHSNQNNAVTGAPGAPGWAMAPIALNWSQKSSAQICQLLTTPQDNGGRSPAQLMQFMSENPLALWGWNPGGNREPVNIPHDKLVTALQGWIAAGTPCPPGTPPSQ
ncbi:hypothetical protein [uncultured Microbulbifer sp.]|uniref:hypothetical protein n=1 Tax=uncultured Microbulbifer sp. TaxID=348147 RepID=UPI00263A3C35|nr:hypothetical protein [uncultured Microbulbifer sp.]